MTADNGPPDRACVVHHRTDELLVQQHAVSDGQATSFNLTNLRNSVIKVGADKAQTRFTQYYNCQRFGHIWGHCKQPPGCLWCGEGHRRQECLGKDNTLSLSFPATTEGVVAPRSSDEESCIMTALRYLQVATSLPKLLIQANPTPQL